MKNHYLLLVSILLLGISFSGFSQKKVEGIHFIEGKNIDEVFKQVKQHKKGPQLIMVECYTQWCGPCKAIAQKVFPDKKAGDYFNKNFVNVRMDIGSEVGKAFNERYKIVGVPTFLFLDTNGKELNRFVGVEVDVNWLINQAEKSKDFTKASWYLKEKFDKTGTIEDALNYLNSRYVISKYDSEITPFLEAHCSIFKEYEIFSYNTWKFFETALSFFGHSKIVSDYVLQNKQFSIYGVGVAKVNQCLYNYYKDAIAFYLNGDKFISKEYAELCANNMQILYDGEDNYGTILLQIFKARQNNDIEAESNILLGAMIHKITEERDLMNILVLLKKNPAISSEIWRKYTDRIASRHVYQSKEIKDLIDKKQI